MFSLTIGSYFLSATVGTSMISSMSRSQGSMLAVSLMLMGAVTCIGSSILTRGSSAVGYLIGIIIYKMGMGFFIPLRKARAIEHLAKNADTGTDLVFFIDILMATLLSTMTWLLPEAGTLTLSSITLIAIIISTLCLLGVDREPDRATMKFV